MTTSPLVDSRAAWLRLAISLTIGVVGNIGMWAIIVILPDVQKEFNVDRADASLPYTLTMIGFALGNFYLGKLADKLGIFKVLLLACGMLCSGYFLCTIAPNIWAFSAIQLIIGIGTGASFSPLMADISHWFFRRRGIAVALVASGNYLSGAVWPILLNDIASQEGWREVYHYLLFFVPVIVIPLAYVMGPSMPTTNAVVSTKIQKSHKTSFSPSTLQYLLAIAGVGCCVAMSMPQVHIVAYCVDLGYGPAVGAEMLSLMLLGGVFSRIGSGLLADKIGGMATLMLGAILQCLALFIYLPFDGLVPLYIVSLVFGLSQGGIVPSYALVIREYLPANEAGQRIGFVVMATIWGMALGGWMSGWIYDMTQSYQLAFVNGIAWNILNIAIIMIVFFNGRPSSKLSHA